jgi:hypothetical protein
MKKILPWIVGLIVAAAVFTLIEDSSRTTTAEPPTPAQLAAAEQRVDNAVTDLRERSRRPDGTVDMDRMVEEGQKKQAEVISNASTQTEKQMVAAASVYGQLFRVTIGFVDWCAREGVDASPFAAAFRQYNSDLIEKAELVYGRNKLNLSPMREAVIKKLPAMVDEEFQHYMRQQNLTGPEFCKFLNDDRERIVAETSMRNRAPGTYQLLMAYN